MKKYIEIPLEVLESLVDGKRVEGSLRRDKWTGKIIFKGYNRLRHKNSKDVLIKKLPGGWLKESKARHKRYTSVPNDLTLEEQLAIMDEENEQAKRALVESYILAGV